jgi:succinate-acetate transporter protein
VAADADLDGGAAGAGGAVSEAPEARVVLRPLASPLPLGFLGLAGGTVVVAGLNLGWVEPSEQASVALIVAAFTVPLQLLASVLAFLARDGVVATGMGILAGTWLAQALVLHGSQPGSTSDALGIVLVVAAAALLVPVSAAAADKLVPAVVLGTAALRFLVTGIYQLTGEDAWGDAAGAVGLFLGALALYAAWAAELEDARGRSVLPLARREQARGPGAGLLGEPGVRDRL